MRTVLDRWNRISPVILCVVFSALAVWSIIDGEYDTGALQFAFAAFWLLAATGVWAAVFRKRRTGG